jgi:cell division protein FtsL
MIRSYSTLLFWLGMMIVSSVALYHTSDRVNELDRQLRNINMQIDAEQANMHVLNAEWVYLANPARIEAATHRHLALQPTQPRHVAMMNDLGTLLPLRGGVELTPPVQMAQATVEQPTATHSHIVQVNAGRLNDHMIMQHATAVQSSTDQIGALIGTLGLRP